MKVYPEQIKLWFSLSRTGLQTTGGVLLDRENPSCTAGILQCCLESMSVCFGFPAPEIVSRECASEEFSKRSDLL